MPMTTGIKIKLSFFTKPDCAVQHAAFMKLNTANGSGISLDDFCEIERFIAVSGLKYSMQIKEADVKPATCAPVSVPNMATEEQTEKTTVADAFMWFCGVPGRVVVQLFEQFLRKIPQ